MRSTHLSNWLTKPANDICPMISARIEAASAAADRVSLFLAKLALAGICLTILFQITLRYGLRSPPAWTEELARYLMVWGGLLGATSAFRRGADPSIFPVGTSGKARVFSLVCVTVCVVIFLAPVLYYSIFGLGMNLERGFMARSLARTSSGLGINLAIIGAAVPACCILIMLHLAAMLTRPNGKK